MANVTAAMVKDLREKTGAGMMDCKAALTETGGDIEAAVDWLRKKGLSKAAKKSGRTAAEGLVGLAAGEGRGVIVEVNSETDFVARNERFQALVRDVAAAALDGDADAESLRAARLTSGETVSEAITGAIATVGENMELRRVGRLTVSPGVIGTYLHGSIGEGLGRIGVLVALESEGKPEVLTALGRQIAMHVAATGPLALDASRLDPEVVAREKTILADRHLGKPQAVIDKITGSGLKTYYKEVALMEQSFVHDGSKTVAQAIKAAEGEAGAPIRLTAFLRFALGEGIERETSDFAAEVAAASGTAPRPDAPVNA